MYFLSHFMEKQNMYQEKQVMNNHLHVENKHLLNKKVHCALVEESRLSKNTFSLFLSFLFP